LLRSGEIGHGEPGDGARASDVTVSGNAEWCGEIPGVQRGRERVRRAVGTDEGSADGADDAREGDG